MSEGYDFLSGFLNIRRNAQRFYQGRVSAIKCRWCAAEVPLNKRTGSFLCLTCDWPAYGPGDFFPPDGFKPVG